MRWRRFLLFALLSGCVRIPESEQAVAESSVGVSSLVEETLRSGAFEKGEWVRQQWWKELDDSALTWLVEQGLSGNPSLKLAQERLKAATEVALQKRAALYPELDVDAFDTWVHLSKEGFFRAYSSTIPAVANDFYIGLSFSYEFDFWGKNRHLLKAALGEVAARCAETMQAELIVTTSIAYTYFELQFLLKKKHLLQKRQQNRCLLTTFREHRQKGAVDTALEPLAAKADTLDIEAELKEVEIDVKAQVHKLKALAGLSQDTELAMDQKTFKPLRLQLPETLSLDLIARRPDLIAQRKRVEAAAHQIDAAKTHFYPNLNLKAFLGTESVIWSKLFEKDNWDLVAIPAFHLPIFTAGRIRANLYEKNAEFNEAVYSYNQLILQTAQEIADSLTKIDALVKEIEVRRASLQVASAQEAIALHRFNEALDNKTSTLQATDNVLRKELFLTTIEYGTQLAEIELIRQLGGGFHE